jgi:hypothetical protein
MAMCTIVAFVIYIVREAAYNHLYHPSGDHNYRRRR